MNEDHVVGFAGGLVACGSVIVMFLGYYLYQGYTHIDFVLSTQY